MEEKRLKIAVLCASRGNPSGLRTTIGALNALASGYHNVEYVLGCDEDDAETKIVPLVNGQGHFPPPLDLNMRMSGCWPHYCYSKRHISLGGKWNEIAGRIDADVYVLVTDRSQCITPYWDLYIADSLSKDDMRPIWWTTNAGPVIPIIPKKWYEASGNKIFTDYFPFWFDDTWLHEISACVFGLPNLMIQASCFIQKRNPMTKRLRDLRFWMNFFIAKRPERMEQAARIRSTLGLPAPDLKPVHEWMKATDEMWAKQWQRWQEAMGDKSEPDESYLQAKKNAEEMMA